MIWWWLKRSMDWKRPVGNYFWVETFQHRLRFDYIKPILQKLKGTGVLR